MAWTPPVQAPEKWQGLRPVVIGAGPCGLLAALILIVVFILSYLTYVSVVGALIVIRPGMAVFSPAALLPLMRVVRPSSWLLGAIVLSTFVFMLAHTLWLAAIVAGLAEAIGLGKRDPATITTAVTDAEGKMSGAAGSRARSRTIMCMRTSSPARAGRKLLPK